MEIYDIICDLLTQERKYGVSMHVCIFFFTKSPTFNIQYLEGSKSFSSETQHLKMTTSAWQIHLSEL